MKNKPNISKLISKIKQDKKQESPKKPSMRIDIDYTKPKPQFRERDMRQEAMDIKAHGADEYFKGGTA